LTQIKYLNIFTSSIGRERIFLISFSSDKPSEFISTIEKLCPTFVLAKLVKLRRTVSGSSEYIKQTGISAELSAYKLSKSILFFEIKLKLKKKKISKFG